MQTTTMALSKEERSRLLEQAIRPYLKTGWLVQGQTDTRAQLVKRAKKKSCLLIIVLLLLGVVPGIVYLLWPSKDQVLIMEIDPTGKVSRAKAKA